MTTKSKLTPPSEMSSSEKKAFARLVKTLSSQGIDAPSRAHIIEDFVYSESGLAELRKEYKTNVGSQKLATARAINVASSVRRRIHQELFAVAKNINGRPERNGKQRGEVLTEAAQEWLTYLQDRKGRPKSKKKMIDVGEFVKKIMRGDARSRQLEKKYGPPPFAALCHPSLNDPE